MRIMSIDDNTTAKRIYDRTLGSLGNRIREIYNQGYKAGYEQGVCDMKLEADTVEVVRCKDCKHYKPFDKSKKFDCPQGLYAVFENDYCSHGERSE